MSALHPKLLEARRIAEQLFSLTQETEFWKPGRRESELNEAFFQLARDAFGIERFWHKRIIRIGANTIHPYRVNPTDDLALQEEDIAYIDYGPVIGDIEADYGRTYVFGENPKYLKLVNALQETWNAGKDIYLSDPHMTGNALFKQMKQLAESSGYTLTDWHSGHIIGEFPHERAIGDEAIHYICPDNKTPMSSRVNNKEPRTWILEVHLVDPSGQFGGFIEDILLPGVSV